MTELMYNYLKTLEKVPGIWGEFGVFRGDTFKKLIPIAVGQNKYLFGVDSFEGMLPPTKNDAGHYPKGNLNSKGYGKLKDDLTKMGYEWDADYMLYAGFIPKVFKNMTYALWTPAPIPNKNFESKKISFSYIDLDQYLPTKQTLEYVWNRMSKEGLILFDDYIERYDILATKAIKEFLQTHSHEVKIEEKGVQLIKGGCKSQLLIRKI